MVGPRQLQKGRLEELADIRMKILLANDHWADTGLHRHLSGRYAVCSRHLYQPPPWEDDTVGCFD